MTQNRLTQKAIKPVEILLASVGTMGDVLPFLSIGQRLVDRGHHVTLITNPHFASHVRDAGMEIAEAGTTQDYLNYVNDPNLWHPIRGIQVSQRVLSQLIRPTYRYIEEHWQKANMVIAASPYCMAARLAQEAFNLPLVTINLAPFSLGNRIRPPSVHTSFVPDKIPSFLRPLYGMVFDRITDQFFAKSLNAFRSELGFPSVRRLMRWWHSTSSTVSLFPEWFAPPDGDLPMNHRYLGFPSGYCSQVKEDKGLEAFLSGNSKPLLIFPGSGVSRGRKFFEQCSDICLRMNRLGIFVAPMIQDLVGDTPAHMYLTRFASMTDLLPQVAAVIHHGGIGIVGDCLRAGVPQLIRPMTADQPDNAQRVERLQVGSWLSPSQFGISTAIPKLEYLLGDPNVQKRCLEYRQRIHAQDALESLSHIIESHAC